MGSRPGRWHATRYVRVFYSSVAGFVAANFFLQSALIATAHVAWWDVPVAALFAAGGVASIVVAFRYATGGVRVAGDEVEARWGLRPRRFALSRVRGVAMAQNHAVLVLDDGIVALRMLARGGPINSLTPVLREAGPLKAEIASARTGN